MNGSALIAFIRECHKDCGGCPVENLCDQHEALLAGASLTLTPKQVEETRNFCRAVIGAYMAAGANLPHHVYDEAYCIIAHFPLNNALTGGAHASQ